ncbi:MAG: hypothetical protein ABL974_05390, partial [Prosthecobacter sp.]
ERVVNPPPEPTDIVAQSIIAGEEHFDGIIEFVVGHGGTEWHFTKEWVRQYRPKTPHILVASSDFIERNFAAAHDSSYLILADSASPPEIVRLLEGLIRKSCN